jgi:hypothetical protein
MQRSINHVLWFLVELMGNVDNKTDRKKEIKASLRYSQRTDQFLETTTIMKHTGRDLVHKQDAKEYYHT